jgi:hypothetical protein
LFRLACNYQISSLIPVCVTYINQITTVDTVVRLLEDLRHGLTYLPGLLKFAGDAIEKIRALTDFSFLNADDFQVLIANGAFISVYNKQDTMKRYNLATGRMLAPPNSLGEPPRTQGLLAAFREEVTVTSCANGHDRDPRSILSDRPRQPWFAASDHGNAWIAVDFGEHHIRPTHYSLWSHGGSSTLRSWSFQGSNDRVNWTVLSEHHDDERIRQPFATATWQISSDAPFRYFRVLQIGNNWAGNRWMYVLKLEIYGDVE